MMISFPMTICKKSHVLRLVLDGRCSSGFFSLYSPLDIPLRHANRPASGSAHNHFNQLFDPQRERRTAFPRNLLDDFN